MFIENGYNIKQITDLIEEFTNNHDRERKKEEDKPIVKMPWIPKIGPKIRKEMKNIGYKTIFTSSNNLKNILCNNKSKLIPNSFPGVYQLKCSCESIYIGETKKRVLTRCIEHQTDSMSGKWESSGATEHTKSCHGLFDWLHPETLSVNPNYHERKIRESLEINYAETKYEIYKQNPILNRDRGNLVDTNSWKPLFRKISGQYKRTKTRSESTSNRNVSSNRDELGTN